MILEFSVFQKLHEAKDLLCEVMEELEDNEEIEMRERRNYRMNRRSNYRGRFDY